MRGAALATAGLALLVLSGCASMRVNSYLERGIDFSKYRTYAWAPVERFSTGDPRLDNNNFFQDRLRAGVEARLAARGFRKSDGAAPDVVVHYHASVSQQIDLNALDPMYANCDRGSCGPSVYEAGTLVLDLVDGSTSRLVWRGWAETSMENVIDNQRFLEETIDQAVTRILARLPQGL